MRKIEEIANMQEEWAQKGFIGAAIFSAFARMQIQNLDVVFDRDNEVVREYAALVSKYLMSDNRQLILMVSTEIERGIAEEDYDVCRRLADEAYEHFIRSGEEYPIQAVCLHGNILGAFFIMGMIDEWNNYYWEYYRVQKSMFGKESYLFCRNWCALLLVISEYLPEVAYEEFEEKKDLFSKYLCQEMILYQLCIKEAVFQEKRNNNPEDLRRGLDECRKWVKNCGNNVTTEIENLIKRMEGLYYRHIGEIDKATELFLQAIGSTEDLNFRLYAYGQLATMLCTKRDKEGLWSCLKAGLEESQKLHEPNENITELYNLMGIYYLLDNRFEMALGWFEKARSISFNLFGADTDNSTKYEVNACRAEFQLGSIDTARRRMGKILEKVLGSTEKYPETIPLAMNNLFWMSAERVIDVQACKNMKRVLDSNQLQYDFSTVIIYKSNLYLCLIINDMNQEDIDELEGVLEDYYTRNPNGDGYEQYLQGKTCRYWSQGKIEKAYLMAERLRDVIAENRWRGDIIGYSAFKYAVIQVSILLYRERYAELHAFMTDIGEQYLKPLFIILSERMEENVEIILLMLRSYISLLISIVIQYPEVGVSPEELYGYVLNYKYLIRLFDLDKEKFRDNVSRTVFFSNELKIDENAFVLEYFEYTRYDMGKGLKLLWEKEVDIEKDMYQIVFAVSEVIEILYNKWISEIGMEHFDNAGAITNYEKEVCSFLLPRLYGRNRIYSCEYGIGSPIPLAAIRIRENTYLGDFFVTIYCNTGWHVKEDIEILNPEDSIFIGVSSFNKSHQKQKKGLGTYFSELPYVREEIKHAIRYTGGSIINSKSIKNEIHEVRCEIIHLASHAVMDNTTGMNSLLLGEDHEDDSNVLSPSDIAEMDWKEVKLVVLSGCNTGSEALQWAVGRAGAQASITTCQGVDDDINMFFMKYFYQYLVEVRKIGEALFRAQKKMRSVTKQELLSDPAFLDIDMSYYLQGYEDEDRPFAYESAWGVYLYRMN